MTLKEIMLQDIVVASLLIRQLNGWHQATINIFQHQTLSLGSCTNILITKQMQNTLIKQKLW